MLKTSLGYTGITGGRGARELAECVIAGTEDRLRRLLYLYGDK
jgi:hypothetical protein